MKTIAEILLEKKEKEEKEKKIIFVETDPLEPFPNDTISSLQKLINKECKDLQKQWTSAIELIDFVFKDNNVPKPMAYNKKRWDQYNHLISYAVKNLYDSRGLKGSWVTTI